MCLEDWQVLLGVGGDDVSKYKGKEKYGEVLLEYLDKKHQEQVEAGLDFEKEDEVRAYPY